MGGSLFTILKEKFPSKEERIKKVEKLRERLSGTPEERARFNSDKDHAYRDGIWDSLTQVIVMIKEGEL